MSARALVVALLLAAAPAHARIVLHHDGRHAWPTGPIPEPWRASAPAGFEAGVSCETFGVLWTDLFTWDCQPCLVNKGGRSTMSLAGAPAPMVAAIEQRYGPGDARRGLWEAHGRWFLLMVALSLIGAALSRRRRRDAALSSTAGEQAVDVEATDADAQP